LPTTISSIACWEPAGLGSTRPLFPWRSRHRMIFPSAQRLSSRTIRGPQARSLRRPEYSSCATRTASWRWVQYRWPPRDRAQRDRQRAPVPHGVRVRDHRSNPDAGGSAPPSSFSLSHGPPIHVPPGYVFECASGPNCAKSIPVCTATGLPSRVRLLAPRIQSKRGCCSVHDPSAWRPAESNRARCCRAPCPQRGEVAWATVDGPSHKWLHTVHADHRSAQRRSPLGFSLGARLRLQPRAKLVEKERRKVSTRDHLRGLANPEQQRIGSRFARRPVPVTPRAIALMLRGGATKKKKKPQPLRKNAPFCFARSVEEC